MTPDAAARQLVHAWRMVVQRGKREKIFKEIQYIAVFEETKKGWPHLHILARTSWIAQAWLADRMQQYANSPIVDVRKVKTKERAAWYVSKYVAKEPHRYQGCKRYWRTHGYDLTNKTTEKPLHDHFQGYAKDWHVDDVAALYEAHSYILEWTSAHSFIAYPTTLNLHNNRTTRHPPINAPPKSKEPT